LGVAPQIFPQRGDKIFNGPIWDPVLDKLRKVGEQRYCRHTTPW